MKSRECKHTKYSTELTKSCWLRKCRAEAVQSLARSLPANYNTELHAMPTDAASVAVATLFLATTAKILPSVYSASSGRDKTAHPGLMANCNEPKWTQASTRHTLHLYDRIALGVRSARPNICKTSFVSTTRFSHDEMYG
ncbi:hypothetical protein J6590_010083 [Homalodisca vitripennis]|nr:hypothetical protein J6590_010083 [Homalodisca vitripennis]